MNKLILLIAALFCTLAHAEPVRIGGDYKVTAIDRLKDGAFVIEFKSTAPSGKFDVLHLESDHVHVAVKVGQQIRLSAEILAEKGSTAEVSQMVIFLPSVQGHVPVWLLSNKAPANEHPSSKYLEMHNPLNDYIIM
jgi:hypothetical protein